MSNLAYDTNGNIQTLTSNAQDAMDDLAYEYDADRPKWSVSS